jgi:hypothetical protein
MLPTPQEFLNRLAANPADAAEFDRYAQGRTRAQAVEDTLTAVKASLAENAALKAKLAATKAKQAALERAKISQSIMKNTVTTPTKATTGTITAAAFAKPQMTMLRSEWQNLSNADKSRFFAEGGKLVEAAEPAKPLSKGGQLTREGLRALSPQAQNAYFAKGGRLAE